MSIISFRVFSVLHSKTYEPVDNMTQNLLVPNPCIIETGSVNKDYATVRVSRIWNDNMLNRGRAGLQIMSNGRCCLPGSSIDKL